MSAPPIRNVAIIAHVDHGKTTLVDKLLYQSGQFRSAELDKLAGGQHGLIMDSNDLERERGITILAKNCAVRYHDEKGVETKINLLDTPGHADFGGEVERVLRMADGVLLLVDAAEGPMPQTRFVLAKALSHNLKPVVVVNKADRPDARPDEVVSEVFDLLVDLGANDQTLDFPVLFSSAKEGWAVRDLADEKVDLRPVFEAILAHVPQPVDDPTGPLQMSITALDYSDYVGRIGIGRVTSGILRESQNLRLIRRDGGIESRKIGRILVFDGLARRAASTCSAGDLCAVEGLDPIEIGDCLVDPNNPKPLKPVAIDEPTLRMTFRVNDGPFSGQDGEKLTSRQIKDRLEKEKLTNVALRVEPGQSSEEFEVSGRGLMHLGILLETMRREGFELTVGKPRVILRDIDGQTCEPIERLAVDCPSECQSSVMSLLSDRRAELSKMEPRSADYTHMEFTVPARGLIGLGARMMTATQGRAILHHTFERYEPLRGSIPGRAAGVIVATEKGPVTEHALDSLYDRGVFFIRARESVYEGQIVGEHCRDSDIIANVVKAKQVNNIRSANKEMGYKIRPPREMGLENALAYIESDELVEITPAAIRIRKRMLKESDRRRESRRAASTARA